MNRYKILRRGKIDLDGYFSVYIYDYIEDIGLWLDIGIVNGYGHHDKEGDYIDWSYNAYIFDLTNSKDVRLQEYQDTHIDIVGEYIFEQEEHLVEYYKKNKEAKSNE